jgi:hypothetical protein
MTQIMNVGVGMVVRTKLATSQTNCFAGPQVTTFLEMFSNFNLLTHVNLLFLHTISLLVRALKMDQVFILNRKAPQNTTAVILLKWT